MPGQFFALFSRMKNINRWALMRNTREESLSQHSLEVAATAHALAVIGNKRLGKHYDAPMAALIGMYHDMPEIITGDMPTPVKYYNQKIRDCYGEIERAAQDAMFQIWNLDMDKLPGQSILCNFGGMHVQLEVVALQLSVGQDLGLDLFHGKSADGFE